MNIAKKTLLAAGLAAAVLGSAPASAATYTYYLKKNNDVLTINTDTQTATWVGDIIDATMTSADFGSFTGGAQPNFTYVLDSLTGQRFINGAWVGPNPLNSTTTHPQKLMAEQLGSAGTRFNLWAWWGDPITGGDYFNGVKDYSAQVPAPGMLGLFGLALAAIGWRRRRRKVLAG